MCGQVNNDQVFIFQWYNKHTWLLHYIWHVLGKSLAQSLIKHDDVLLIQSKSQKQRHLLYYHQSHGLHYSIMTVKSDPSDLPSFHFLSFSCSSQIVSAMSLRWDTSYMLDPLP